MVHRPRQKYGYALERHLYSEKIVDSDRRHSFRGDCVFATKGEIEKQSVHRSLLNVALNNRFLLPVVFYAVELAFAGRTLVVVDVELVRSLLHSPSLIQVESDPS